ncbi:hypothetical protein ACOMHN_047833 [Nucella lapillus]
MDQEALLGVLATWGPFQRRLIAVLSLAIIQNGFQALMIIVTLAVPLHRCRIPGLDNDTFEIQSPNHQRLIESAIPSTLTADGHLTFDKCQMYVNGSSYDVSNTTSHIDVNVTQFHEPTVGCERWVYDQSEFQSTVITEFDLVCSRKEFRAHINMAYIVGLLIGSPLSGFLCDTFGRKRCMFLAVLFNGVVGVLSVFPFRPEIFLLCRMLKGALGLTFYMAIYVLLIEMAGAEKRNTMGAVASVLWVGGPLMVGGLSYVLSRWTHLQLVSALPNFLVLLTWRWVPESPRWLLSRGSVPEALQVLREAARVNGSPLPTLDHDQQGEDLKDLPPEESYPSPSPTSSSSSPQGVSAIDSVRQLVKYPNLVVRTFILFFNWCMISMAYYGLTLNVANLGGSVRMNFVLSACVELVGYTAAWILLDRLGRKKTHCTAMLLAGLSCLATILPGLVMDSSGAEWVTTELAMAGKLGISAAFASIYLILPYLTLPSGAEWVTTALAMAGAEWVTTALAMAGKLGISAAFASIYLVSAELFPTLIRNFAIGCCSTAGRLGSITSPYIADLALYVEGSFGRILPFIIFGGMAVAAGLLSLLLPETLGRQLPDSVEEAAQFGKARKSATEGTELAERHSGQHASPLLEKQDH